MQVHVAGLGGAAKATAQVCFLRQGLIAARALAFKLNCKSPIMTLAYYAPAFHGPQQCDMASAESLVFQDYVIFNGGSWNRDVRVLSQSAKSAISLPQNQRMHTDIKQNKQANLTFSIIVSGSVHVIMFAQKWFIMFSLIMQNKLYEKYQPYEHKGTFTIEF